MTRKITGCLSRTLYGLHIPLIIALLSFGSSPLLSGTNTSSKVDNLSTRIFNRQLKQAQIGDAVAQFETAQRLESGKGTKQDLPQAFAWYRKAAEQGLPEAQYQLAVMLETGTGTEKNLKQAQRWYAKSARQKYVLAVARIARLEKTDREAKEKAEMKKRLNAQQEEKRKARREEEARVALEAKRDLEVRTALEVKRREEAQAALEAKQQDELERQLRASQAYTPLPKIQQTQEQEQMQYTIAEPVSTVIDLRPNPQETLALLLSRDWLNGNSEVDFLPSSLSSCIQQGHQLSCFSHEREVSGMQHNLRYMTQSTIKATAPAAITVTYRYQVTRVRYGDNSQAVHSGPNHPLPEKGWQKVFIYQCLLEDSNTLECRNNKNSNITFTTKHAATAAVAR